MKHAALAILIAAGSLAFTSAAQADSFTYDPPGSLVPASGKGRVDQKEYAPGMRFPLEHIAAFANSQVWGVGGSQGPAGGQCDAKNYSYPWHDNYCETRDYSMPLCPSGTGHQGQDIRPGTCSDRTHWAVAVADGTITNIGSYSVYLTANDGTRFDYLHLDDVAVKSGQVVKRGTRMGRVSNVFYSGGVRVPTTWHLHFNIRQNVNGQAIYVPPYMSLVKSYERLLAEEDAGVPPVDETAEAGAPIADAGTLVTSVPAEGGTSNGTDLFGLNPEDGCGCSATPTGASFFSGASLVGIVFAFVRRTRHKRTRIS